MGRGRLRLKHFTKYFWLVGVGAILAAADFCAEQFLSGRMVALLIPLPAIYAATVAAYFFWNRAQQRAGRERTFWLLWASGCLLWDVAGILSFFSITSQPHSSIQFLRMAFTFLPQVLFMAALVMQPENSAGELRDPVVRYEAALVALWWTFLYALILIPWDWLIRDEQKYLYLFSRLHDFQRVCLAAWLATLWLASKGPWRRVYAHLAGSGGLLALSIGFFFQDWGAQKWLPTMLFGAVLTAAFLWMAQSTQISTEIQPGEKARRREPSLGAGVWIASITAIGIPALAVWSGLASSAPEPIRRFRLFLSFAAFAAAMLLLYQWQEAAESERERLVEDLGTSVRELRQLQGYFAEAEKLASLGQLAAGAAHEINNPVAAMLGYSELLRSDSAASERVRDFGRKIGDQARRIRNLVQNLLSLTEHANPETKLIDIAMPLRGAVELSRISGGKRKQEILLVVETEPDSALQAYGDSEKLLQVFYRLLLALLEGDRETKIEVRARSAGGQVTIEFIGRPTRDEATREVYDAQRAQQGKELSLNVCYTIVKELGGVVIHENLIDGGKIFRVQLPATGAPQALQPAVSA